MGDFNYIVFIFLNTMLMRLVNVLSFLSFLLLFVTRVVSQSNYSDLTGPWELMVDDYLIDYKENVVRQYHPFVKYGDNPVLKADKPWEGTTSYLYGTVLPEESPRKGYRMWYHAWNGEYTNLYAVSADGVHWQKPSLGLINFQGTTQNNIFLRRTKEDHLPQVIYTPWEKDTLKRYKLINYDYGRTSPDHLISGFWGAYSSDGVHWKDVYRNPILKDPGDVGNFNWDPHTRSYIGYPKIFAPVSGFNRRCVGYTATEDFERWPSAQLILAPDSTDDYWVTTPGQRTEFYGLSGFAYQSAYLGFLWIFHITDGNNDGPIYCELVSSRDGIRWTRQEAVNGVRIPILPVGKAGSWDQGMVFSTNHPLVEHDTVKLWYGGSDITHDSNEQGRSGVGIATLRKDRFASLNSQGKEGVITTRLLHNLKGNLYINADTKSGQIQVEVLDASGNVLPGYERSACTIKGKDNTEILANWKGKKLPAKKLLKLRFILKNASLFAFRGDSIIKPGSPDSVLNIQPFKDAVVFSPVAEGTYRPVEIPGSAYLGPRFTLSAMVKPTTAKQTRLFSNYRGSGSFVTGELIVDFDPSGQSISGYRFIVNGQSVTSGPVNFRDGKYHQIAVTYDYGKVVLYFDGSPVAVKQLDAGAAHLYSDRSVKAYFDLPEALHNVGICLGNDLVIGGDRAGKFTTYKHTSKAADEALIEGVIKDVLVTTEVLSSQQILQRWHNTLPL